MKTTKLPSDGEAVFVVIGEPGEDAFQLLSDFAKSNQLSAAQITGVGAFKRATVGWFDRDAKDYRHIPVDQQCELLSLVGDIALADNGPQVHAHVVLGLPDGTTRGGHLLSAEVWPTLEVIIRETPAALRKTSHPDLGLALIDPDRTNH
ncbi:PPC domain-containing DNA-binding protein [Sinomonas humi]|uniref:DNA-binding protein with PD1-like DNA-binding motif n=1 Tax=Sinomonas humi TaxID=1338436 RepID=A0A0B2AI19_9MICC|nr:PPC domain-containing DNA-binding protein [Sinomonas humi]KHL02898.1 DNA-binding protein with PD1-like DNA-binding motif [Sinomonas humi]